MGSGMKYTPEFRAEAVRLVVEYCRPVRDVAEQVEVRPATLRTWINRARKEGLEVVRKAETELEVEIRGLKVQLRQKDRDLAYKQDQIDFLKKAASFFAADQFDQQNGSK